MRRKGALFRDNPLVVKNQLGLGKRRKSREIEDELQAAIIEFHAMAVSTKHAILYAVPNGEFRDKKTAYKLTGRKALPNGVKRPQDALLVPGGQGVLPGVYDLMLLTQGGKATHIEAKRPDSVDPDTGEKLRAGRLTDEQEAFRDGIVRLGFEPVVVQSVLEYQAVLVRLGVPLRFRFPG